MKCEICGKSIGYTIEWARCEICGQKLCIDCNHNTTFGYLCPTHYKQVKECINILKGEQMPKIGIGHDDDVYVIATPTNGGWTKATKLSDAEADALYEYIRRERGESDERD